MRFLPVSTARGFFSLLVAAYLVMPAVRAADILHVQGVTILTRVLDAAAPQLKEKGIPIKVEPECGSSQAVVALGNGEIDLALLSRAMTVEERASYPDRSFQEFRLGTQAVVLIVSKALWESGVHSIKREQAVDLYEGRIKTWQALGGHDRPVKFYDNAPGAGIWEIFANWLYSDVRKAPATPWEVVKDGAETQSAVQFDSGGCGSVALRWADGKEVYPLGIVEDTGGTIHPTPANLADNKYPMARPVFIVAGGRPLANKRKLVEFLLSPEGQALMASHDLMPLAESTKPAVEAKP